LHFLGFFRIHWDYTLMKKSVILLTFMMFSSAAQAAVDFEKEILPIFEANCIGCHGAEKAMGKLKLDSAEGVKAKLADEAHLLVAGDPDKSELYERLVLPADSKKRMPKGADPLDQKSIDLIAAWIKEGATLTVTAAVAPATEPAPEQSQPAEETKPQWEELPLPEVAAAPQDAIDKLIAAGAQVLPLYAESHLLDVSFALSPQPPTDDTLKLLDAVASQVFVLNLKNAKASEAGWGVFAKLSNLSALNVQGSSFTDAAAQYLAGLPRLETLNLYGTNVTDAVLEPLKSLPRLRKLYLWKTGVTYDAVLALEKEKPGLEWNLGWDHPVIARQRLEKQKAEFAELLKKSEADTARLKTDLKVAEEAHTAAQKRLQEVEEDLKKLVAEPDTAPPTANEAN
jgi:mono/diheme cytochrome c family protein